MSTSGPPTPVSLNNDDEALSIEWSDGVTHRLGWEMLRARCPCATCRTKVDEPPSLLPVMAIEEATPTRGTAVKPVGNYAYNIQFTDGHNTGIYTLDYLLALGRASV